MNDRPHYPWKEGDALFAAELNAAIMNMATGAMVGETPNATVVEPLWWDSVSGQLFIRYDDGSSVQWVSANSIDASTLEGSFLPITGGTVTGPLNYTATGGTVSRSVQDRAADVANVLDFGADPTGVLDSSIAINAAAAQLAPNGRNKAVYVPAGWYRVNHQITLSGAQCLYGDSRGSSFFVIDQWFDPAAAAVILCVQPPGGLDPGPVIRDLGITFVQPQTVFTRAGMKTLAAGGTCGNGGTGVKYPWAIASGDNSFRIQIIRVRIGGAWDGISSNNHNCVFWLEDIEMGALDCGLSLGEGTEILDACHINGYHFWNFDLTYPGQIAVMSDGQTVAMRFGAVDSLDAKGCGTIWGRVVFTAEATRGWFAFANLALDTDATLEIADAHWLQITNMYVTTAGNSPRPLINANAGTVQLSHVVVVGNAALAQPLLSVRGADVTVHGINAIAYNLASNAVFVDGGTLRMSGARVYAAAASAYTQPLVLQSGTGQLRVTDLDLRGVTGSSGTGLRINADNSPNYVGNVILSAGWVNSYAGTANGNYGPMLPSTGGSMSGSLFLMNGMIFNPFRVATPGDNSKHIDLYQNTYGFNITNDGNLNYNAAGAHVFRVNGAMVGYIFNDLNIPIGGTTPNPGSFTTLSASGTISGTGFSTFLNAPPTIGVTTPNVGSFTVLGTSGAVYLHAAANGGSYTNDALAAAGGVQPHQVYRNGSALMVRVT